MFGSAARKTFLCALVVGNLSRLQFLESVLGMECARHGMVNIQGIRDT